MKIIKVIHGYPMIYNAGSEVYSQTICHGLVNRGHEVHVFTRQEDPFYPDGFINEEFDQDDRRIKLYRVNNPRHRDRYRLKVIDAKFGLLLDKVKPDVVHVGHLNHLSTSLIMEAKQRGVPVVYTLHDYWLMCPRGQFMQMHSSDNDLWAACNGQDDRKCAEKCYARYFSGNPDEQKDDLVYWKGWVARRMAHIREIVKQVDIFISPAKYLKNRYENEFLLPKDKSIYLDYGFDSNRMENRLRTSGEPFTFGYIGTHIPAKGIQQLLEAFGQVAQPCMLKIWGRDRGQATSALKRLVARLPEDKQKCIQWMPEYKNQEIVKDVFNHIDAVVVPSIWVENSPLVIHEAQQARIPLITADVGGMSEYVEHEVNGLLFKHRSVESLMVQMERFVADPGWASNLGKRGYLYSKDGDIPNIKEHITELEKIYRRVL